MALPTPMRVALLTLPLALLLAGCASSGTGMLAVHATDAPDDIGDFAYLNVTVDKITITAKDGKSTDHTPASRTFDLTRLTNGNLTTLFNGSVPVGEYSRLELHLAAAQGVLKADHTTVDVKAPSDRLFLDSPFEVAKDKETDFVFDIQVHREGNGSYLFKPNATDSGARTAAEIGAAKAKARAN